MVSHLLNRSKNLFSHQHTGILSAAGIIAASYLLSAGLGLIRNRLLAARFFGGLESHLDAYFAAFVVPDTVFQLLVFGALSAAFIPVYSDHLKKGLKEANDLANITISALVLPLLGITLLLFIFAHPVSDLISNFPPDETVLMANLMRVMLVSQIFFAFSAFLTGMIQSHRRFLVPALSPLFYNFGIILGIFFLTPYWGIYGAAAGVIVGAVLHMLVQIPLCRHLGYRFSVLWQPNHPGFVTIRTLMIPRTVALGIGQVERWVAVHIATILTAGSLTMFNFARQLYILPISLFGVSLGQASFPALASHSDDQDRQQYRQVLSDTLTQIIFFALPASVLLLVLRIPVVRLVFGARAFPWDATKLTGLVLAVFALSIAPQACTQVLIRAFYALHNTRTPLLISLFTITLSVALSYLLSVFFGYGIVGLAIAISLANSLEAFILYLTLKKRVGDLSILATTLKIVFAAVITGIIFWFLMHALEFIFDTTRTFYLLILTGLASLVGIAIYLLISWILKLPPLLNLISLAKKAGNWQKVLSQSREVIETAP